MCKQIILNFSHICRSVDVQNFVSYQENTGASGNDITILLTIMIF